MQKITTRRGFFGGTAAACLAGAAALPAIAAPNPDAELLSLWREYQTIWETLRIPSPNGGRSDEEMEPINARFFALEDQILRSRALTEEGIVAQLNVFWNYEAIDNHDIDGPREDSKDNLHWLWTIKSNVERLAGNARA